MVKARFGKVTRWVNSGVNGCVEKKVMKRRAVVKRAQVELKSRIEVDWWLMASGKRGGVVCWVNEV